MSKGILGTWNLVSGVNQAVYVNNYSDIATVAVSVCNRNHTDGEVSIAVGTSATSPANADWIEFEAALSGKSVLERSGIIVTLGHFIVVKSSLSNVNAVVWGAHIGTLSLTPVTISTNTSGDGPEFIGPTTIEIFAGDAT
jgi:hypothetical protein